MTLTQSSPHLKRVGLVTYWKAVVKEVIKRLSLTSREYSESRVNGRLMGTERQKVQTKGCGVLEHLTKRVYNSTLEGKADEYFIILIVLC